MDDDHIIVPGVGLGDLGRRGVSGEFDRFEPVCKRKLSLGFIDLYINNEPRPEHSKAFYESSYELLNKISVGLVTFERDGKVQLMNDAAAALMPMGCPGTTTENLYEMLRSVAPDLERQIAQFTPEAGVVVDQKRFIDHTHGREVVVAMTISRTNLTEYMAALMDVTKVVETERLVGADRQKFRAICEYVHDYAIFTVSPDGVIDEWNRSLERHAGWLAQDVEGHGLEALFPPGEAARAEVRDFLAQARVAGSAESEGWRLKRDGAWFWGNTVLTALPDDLGKLIGFVAVSRDMSERKRMEDNMKRLATIDSLTGAFNRRQAEAWLAAEHARQAREGRPFALLMIDIDQFKDVNDRYGHATGDDVLRTLVRVCSEVMRAADMVARWGGEEFLVGLPGAGGETARLAAERLRAALLASAVRGPDGEAVSFTVSIGVAAAGASEDPVNLIRRADLALYAAKHAGRNRVMTAD